MLKIRLMRIGAKKRPFYRVVIVDERAKRTGGYIEAIGTYNPLTEPKDIKLNQERLDYWLKQGAQKSDGFLRVIGEAPKRPARKPKKEKQTAAPAAAPSEPTQPAPEAEAATKSSEGSPDTSESTETSKPAEENPETETKPE